MLQRHSGIAALSLALGLLVARQGATRTSATKPAPEFPTKDAARWVGEPRRMAELRGRVVLLDVWTFG